MSEYQLQEIENEDLHVYLTVFGKYKRNADNIPKEDLMGKYKNAFQKLKTELKRTGIFYCYKTITEYLYIENSAAGNAVSKKAVQMLADNQNVLVPLLFSGDVKKLDEVLLKIRSEFMDSAWISYSKSISEHFKTPVTMQAG